MILRRTIDPYDKGAVSVKFTWYYQVWVDDDNTIPEFLLDEENESTQAGRGPYILSPRSSQHPHMTLLIPSWPESQKYYATRLKSDSYNPSLLIDSRRKFEWWVLAPFLRYTYLGVSWNFPPLLPLWLVHNRLDTPHQSIWLLTQLRPQNREFLAMARQDPFHLVILYPFSLCVFTWI